MADSNSTVNFRITTDTIVRVIGVLLAIAFLWVVRDVVVLLFVCLIFASALDPTVAYLKKYRIPRALGIISIYVVVISIFLFIVVGISKPIADEIRTIARDLPSYYIEINDSLNSFLNSSPFITPDRATTLRGGLDDMIINLTRIGTGNIIPLASAVFGGLLSVMLGLVISFYFMAQEGSIKQFIVWLVPRSKEQETISIIEKIQTRLGLWLRGQLLLSFIIFIITYVGLKILGVQYALLLSLLAGFFEVVPYLGPVLSAVPAIFLTLISPDWGGPFKALIVMILYILVQQAENNLIVPKVMAKIVGLNPLVVIVSIIIGAKVAGIVGSLIAVPIAIAVTVYLEAKGYKKELVA